MSLQTQAYVSTLVPANRLSLATSAVQTNPRRKNSREEGLPTNRKGNFRVPRRRRARRVEHVPQLAITAVPMSDNVVDALVGEYLLTSSDKGNNKRPLKGDRLVYQRNLEMKLMAKKKDLEGCLKVLGELRKGKGMGPDKYSYSIALSCCARVDAVDVAVALVNTMKLEGVAIDDYIRTNLLVVAANSKPPRLELCERLFATVSKPSRYMCNVIMDAYARVGNLDHTISLYRYMGLRGMQPDRYTVSAIVKAYVKTLRLDDAVEFLHDMHMAGVELHSAPFGQLMDAFGKRGLMDKALDLFDSMILLGIPPTQVTYNILIGACASTGLTTRAFEIYEEMKATSSFSGDRYTIHALMKCCLQSRHWRKVLQLYHFLQTTPFPCNQVSYRYALTAAGQGLDGDAVIRIAHHMARRQAPLREDTAAVLVAAAIRCSDLELALRSFAHYTNAQSTTQSRHNAFFNAIRHSLRAFEQGHTPAVPDFVETETVVAELERAWKKRT